MLHLVFLQYQVASFVPSLPDTFNSSTVHPAHLSVEVLPGLWEYLLSPVQPLQVYRGNVIFPLRKFHAAHSL